MASKERPRHNDFSGKDLVRALGHPVRVEILEVLGEGEASPKMLTTYIDGATLQVVSYHTKLLFECGCLEQTRTAQRRGAQEHFYRAVPESFVGYKLWRQVPPSMRGTAVILALKSFIGKLVAALKVGVHEEDDTTLSAVTLFLDVEGRAEAVRIARRSLEQLVEADRKSRDRSAAAGTDMTPMVGAVALFKAAGSVTAE